MKRGLKVLRDLGLAQQVDAVEESSPMKRGLKGCKVHEDHTEFLG